MQMGWFAVIVQLFAAFFNVNVINALFHNVPINHIVPYQPGDEVNDYVLEILVDVAGNPHGRSIGFWNSYEQSGSLLIGESSTSTKPVFRSVLSPLHRTCADGLANDSFCLEDKIFHGGHGDIWRGRRVDSSERLILKRMRTETSVGILRCAQREVYFGKLLRTIEGFPFFVTHFVLNNEYWLVFRDEGASLQSYLYNVDLRTSFMFSPSAAWRKLRTTALGSASIKSILFQLMQNTAVLHRRRIIHRDIKPSNILLQESTKPRLISADFSSAVDFTLAEDSLYDEIGPSIAQATLAYAPPEVILSLTEDTLDDPRAIPFDFRRPESYDIWSVGVVFLELILGTAEVFRVAQRTETIIDRVMERKGVSSSLLKKKAVLLAGLSDYCIWSQPSPEEDRGDELLKSRRSSPGRIAVEIEHLLQLLQPESLLQKSDTLVPQVVSSEPQEDVDLSDSFSMSEQSISHLQQSHNVARLKALSLLPNSMSAKISNSGETNCGIEILSAAIQRRDVLGLGFHDRWGLDLISRLLKFDPQERVSMNEALSHAYFHGPYTSRFDPASEFATRSELEAFDRAWNQSKGPVINHNSDPAVAVVIPVTPAQPTVATPRESSVAIIQDAVCLSYENQVNVDFLALEKASDTIPTSQDDSEAEIGAGRVYRGLTDQLARLQFYCGRCSRVFSEWHTCQQHMKARRHGSWCGYLLDGEDIEDVESSVLEHNANVLHTILPGCLSDQQSLANRDEDSGWCDLTGRRKIMEDFHSIYVTERFQWFAIFDGHCGSFAARFAANGLHHMFERAFNESVIVDSHFDWEQVGQRLNSSLVQAFVRMDEELGKLHEMDMEFPWGGTTATVLIRDKLMDKLLVAHVGDSRLVICCVVNADDSDNSAFVAVQVTTDHTASHDTEVQDVISRGGAVVEVNNVRRVNGELVVTRSLGDSALGSVLSPVPEVLEVPVPKTVNGLQHTSNLDECKQLHSVWTKRKPSRDDKSGQQMLFAVLASDGLWDVMSNDEAVRMVCGLLLALDLTAEDDADALQRAAQLLAQEAIVRGSLDNVGVAIIDLFK